MTAAPQVRHPKQQVFSIQAARAAAALLVVFTHMIGHGMRGSAPNVVMLSGRFGVEIFFVISGFVIQYVAGNGPFSPGGFAIRRIARVVPLFWLTTLAVAATAALQPSLYRHTVSQSTSLLKSLFFIPYEYPLGSGDWRPLFKLGWTLNYEMFFYLVMALLFWCRDARQRALLLTGVMGALVAASFFVTPRGSVFAFYANLNLVPFVLGVWLAEAWRSDVFSRLPAWTLPAATAAAVVVTLAFYQVDPKAKVDLVPHIAMTAAAFAIVFAALVLETRVALRSRVVSWAGDVSYSLYLIHMFVVGGTWFVLDRVTGGQPPLWLLLIALPAATALSFAISWASYRLFEIPINRVGAALAKRWEGGGPAAQK